MFKNIYILAVPKNIRFCVESGLTAPGFPTILTVNYSSKKRIAEGLVVRFW